MHRPLNIFLLFPAFLLVLIHAGCGTASSSAKLDFDPAVCQFFLEEVDGDANTAPMLPMSHIRLPLGTDPVILESDIVNAELGQTGSGAHFLQFQLRSDAARALYRITVTNNGKRLGLKINGLLVGAMKIDAPFTTGTISMFVELDDASLPKLVESIQKSSDAIQKRLK